MGPQPDRLLTPRPSRAGLRDQVSIAAEDCEALRTLDLLYSNKQFEYIETGSKTFPAFGPLPAGATLGGVPVGLAFSFDFSLCCEVATMQSPLVDCVGLSGQGDMDHLARRVSFSSWRVRIK